jgi:hypothetical protein
MSVFGNTLKYILYLYPPGGLGLDLEKDSRFSQYRHGNNSHSPFDEYRDSRYKDFGKSEFLSLVASPHMLSWSAIINARLLQNLLLRLVFHVP